MEIIDKIALIYIENGKILCTLVKGKTTYYLPGGKRDEGESDAETLIRECKEELTVDIKPETMEYYGTFKAQAHGKADGVIVKMTCYTAEFDGKLSPDSEVEELVWLDYNDLDRISPVDKFIFEDLNQKGLING